MVVRGMDLGRPEREREQVLRRVSTPGFLDGNTLGPTARFPRRRPIRQLLSSMETAPRPQRARVFRDAVSIRHASFIYGNSAPAATGAVSATRLDRQASSIYGNSAPAATGAGLPRRRLDPPGFSHLWKQRPGRNGRGSSATQAQSVRLVHLWKQRLACNGRGSSATPSRSVRCFHLWKQRLGRSGRRSCATPVGSTWLRPSLEAAAECYGFVTGRRAAKWIGVA